LKKNKILFSIAILLTLVFVAYMLFFNKIHNLWFSVFCGLVGIYAFCYYKAFKMDSSLYYSSLLISVAVSSGIMIFNEISMSQYYPIYIACFAFASLAVFVKFRQKFHFKLFANLFIECIILIGYKLNYLNVLTLIIINCIFLSIILFNIIFRVRKNLRRVK